MASWEKLLKPKFDAAVPYTADLIEDAAILDKLLAKNVLSSHSYKKLSLKSSDPEKAARELLLLLQVGTKFEKFLDLLRNVEGGKELYNELTRSEALSEEKEAASGTAKEDIKPNVETDSESDSDSDSDENKGRTILMVHVLRKYKQQYKKHKDSFRSTIKRTFRKVYKKRVKVDEAYPKKLRRSFHSAHVAVSETVIFRIVFPRLSSGQVFEPHRQCIVRDLAGAMSIREDKVEIFAFDGSCILSIAIPGDGFIRFVAALGVPGKLDFLYTVDDEVIVKIDGLPEFPLKTLHDTQDEEALKFPNRDAEKRLQKEKYIAEDIVTTSQSHPDTASDEAISLVGSTIASAIGSTFIPNAKRDNRVLIRLGQKRGHILEIMQQSENRFTPDQVTEIMKERSSEEKGRSLLRSVDEANDGVKASFAFALLAVDSNLLNDVSSRLLYEVAKSAAKEFIRIGGATVQKVAYRLFLESTLVEGDKREITIFVVGSGKTVIKDALFDPGFRKECIAFDDGYHTGTGADYDQIRFPLEGMRRGGLINVVQCATSDEELLRKHLTKIALKGKDVDLVIFCVDCTDRRKVSIIESVANIIKRFGNAFTKTIWKHCMFALTKANLLRSPEEDDTDQKEKHFRDVIESLVNRCHDRLLRNGVDQEVIDSIQFVPVGSGRDRVLADGKPWLPEFYVSAVETASATGGSVLLVFNEKRLQLDTDEVETSLGKQKEKIVLSAEQVRRILGRVGAADAVAEASFFGNAKAAISAGVGAVGRGIASLFRWMKETHDH